VVETADQNTIISVGRDLKLKEMEEQPNAGTQITKEIDTGELLNQILLPQVRLLQDCKTDCFKTNRYLHSDRQQHVVNSMCGHC
jgi:hypothetical protein